MNEEQTILENTKLINYMITKMHLYYSTDDEYQAYYDDGLIGLINGVKTYNDEKNIKLSTYLATCIKNSILRGIYLNGLDKRKANFECVSLNTVVNDGEKNKTELLDFIPNEKIDVEEETEKKITLEAIITELNNMKLQKDALCIKMYYGLDGEKQLTTEEIAKKLNISRSAVNFKIKRGIENIKKEKERMVRNYMKETIIEKNDGEIVVFKEKENKALEPLQQVNSILLDQLNRLTNLNMEDKEMSKLEIARSNAISSTSKTIIQTIGLQMMAEKQKYKFLQIENK